MKKQIKAMRMDKFLSQTLNVTRTEAKKMLKQGRISKNDVVCKDGAEKADAIAQKTMKRVRENFGLGIE